MWLNTYCLSLSLLGSLLSQGAELVRRSWKKLKNDNGQEDEREGPFRCAGNLINLFPAFSVMMMRWAEREKRVYSYEWMKRREAHCLLSMFISFRWAEDIQVGRRHTSWARCRQRRYHWAATNNNMSWTDFDTILWQSLNLIWGHKYSNQKHQQKKLYSRVCLFFFVLFRFFWFRFFMFHSLSSSPRLSETNY